jgi:hypothetical protein
MRKSDKRDFSAFLRFARFPDPFDTAILPVNPHPNATVGFLCNYPEDFWTFAPIVERLPEAEYVFTTAAAIPQDDRGKRLAALIINQLANLARKQKANWRIFVPFSLPEDALTDEEKDLKQAILAQELKGLQNFFQKYEVIVATTTGNFLSNPALSHKKKILLYENANIRIAPEKLSYLDGILVPGEFMAPLFRAFAETLVIGSPRLERIREHTTASSGNRRTLLYFPSRVNPKQNEAIGDIAKFLPPKWRLQVIIPHFRQISRHAWNQRKQTPTLELYFKGEIDKAMLIARADIVMVEDAEHILECLFFERSIMLFDSTFDIKDWNFNEQLVPQANTKSFGIQDPTVADMGVIFKNPESLPTAIRLFFKPTVRDTIREFQQKLRPIFFKPQSSEIGALSAADFIRTIQKSKRPPESIISRMYAQYNSFEKLVEYYKNSFGITPPYGSLTLVLLRWLMKHGQR